MKIYASEYQLKRRIKFIRKYTSSLFNFGQILFNFNEFLTIKF